MEYVMGLDLGTSSLKGIVMTKFGEIVETKSVEYPCYNFGNGMSEQKPQTWASACEEIIQYFCKTVTDFTTQLYGISISGQMHSLVLIDQYGQPLRNAILWNDVRTTKECQLIMKRMGSRFLDITKNNVLEGFTLPKILWVQAHEPEIWRRVYKILMPKDYLLAYLTGQYVTDFSDASGTMLIDMNTKNWSTELTREFVIKEEILPRICKSTECVGEMRKELKDMFKLKRSVKIFAGGADNACSAVGAGIFNSKIGMVSVGTSGVFLQYESILTDKVVKGNHFFCHIEDNKYYSMGVTLAAGDSLSWFKSVFSPDKDFDKLLSKLNSSKPGAHGLLFSPYISGERTPYSDSKIRGSFIGIDKAHTIDDFYQAVVEGITFSIKDCQELLNKNSKRKIERMVSVGGAAKNKEWLKIQADIFDSEIMTIKEGQGPGTGACIIAAVGLGWYPTLQDCQSTFVDYTETIYPDKEKVKEYSKIYSIYKEIYPNTHKITHDLINVQKEI